VYLNIIFLNHLVAIMVHISKRLKSQFNQVEVLCHFLVAHWQFGVNVCKHTI
jgi:hypothetical protein